MNPLYGRDTYNGQFARPAGAASNNLYNLADFMLGLRAQYALSSVLVADLRRNMHFAYLQDDWRATSRLTLNLGVRYEYSTPHWEENNVLSNFDPATNTMILARRRIDLRPRAHQSRSQQLRAAPRVCLHADAGDGDSRRLRPQLRALQPRRRRQTSCRSTVRRWSTRSSTRRCRPRPTFVPAEQGYPVGLADPSKFNPLTANITYMPPDFHSSPVAELVHLGAARAAAQHARRRRLRRQPCRRPAALRELQSGGAEQRRRDHPAAGPPARSRASRTSPTRSTAASRATRRCRRSSSGAWAASSRSSAR